jgi:hypothetical protein
VPGRAKAARELDQQFRRTCARAGPAGKKKNFGFWICDFRLNGRLVERGADLVALFRGKKQRPSRFGSKCRGFREEMLTQVGRSGPPFAAASHGKSEMA